MNAFPGAREEVVQKTRFGIAAAFLRAQRNQHSLHASAVAIGNGRAIACIGASGIGKSTVADRMCRHTDVLLLGDDVTGIALMPEGMVPCG
jgi:ABC-type transport system involved in cytochrome bd biosynthesis fused ATPase/permease subunit